MGKKVQDLVKGIVITGTAVGGASVFSNMGLAYAHEIETTGEEVVYDSAPEAAQEAPAETASQEPTVTAEVAPEAPAAAPEVQEAAPEAPAAAPEAQVTPEASAVPEAQAAAPEAQAAAPEAQAAAPEVQAAAPEAQAAAPEAQVAAPEASAAAPETQEAPEAQVAPEAPVAVTRKAAPKLMAAPAPQAAPTLMAAPAPQATPESAAQAAPAATTSSIEELEETISSESASVSDAESELLFTSESTSASQSEAIDSMSVAESEAASEYIATSETFITNGYDNAGVAETQQKIAQLEIEEKAQREAIALQRKPALSLNEYYIPYGRPLAEAMIEYKLLVEGKILYANIQNGNLHTGWYGNTYYDKRYVVKWIDLDGNYNEEYFDYVTVDEFGNSLYKDETHQTDINGIPHEDYAPGVYGINVVQKAYAVTDTVSPKKETFKNVVMPDGSVIAKIVSTRYEFDYTLDDEGKMLKGGDWYTEGTYHSQASERSEMIKNMNSLASAAEQFSEDANAFSTSVTGSTSGFVQLSQTIADLASQVKANSQSLSTYKSESLIAASESAASLSTSASEAASISASESASVASSESTSTSTSESTSISTSTSTSSSVSASESASVASSQSGSTSASTSASESASASASVSASEAIEGSESITISNAATEYISDAAGRVDTNVAAGNTYRQAAVITPIDNDARVPLAVLDQEILDDDIVDAPANVDVITGIDDDQVARYGELGPNGWAGASLPIIGGLTGLFVAAKRRKGKETEES
ncbi:hypothetical protein SAMN05660668_02550 [Pseudobutyrivibrio sp. AR14]|uniref:hypothetical protein n=1 Tax=Pseudobutyrivibrio sp. AR14 TaxID=1520804 RepID=UPI000883B314|nr:hypothetical protein [Pseudobutyrivibrio sp. AR14]SCY41524.1 hypothetical protein SAMN05660668_02550 [Pseudobutyrivibrio sp. AR14]